MSDREAIWLRAAATCSASVSVVGVFKGVAAQQECAIVLVHHTRKQASGANGADYVASDMRGTSATHDAVRALRLINHMSQKEAEAAAIPEHERTSYIRVDRGKGNKHRQRRPTQRRRGRRRRTLELPRPGRRAADGRNVRDPACRRAGVPAAVE
jgi:hypothetical protein